MLLALEENILLIRVSTRNTATFQNHKNNQGQRTLAGKIQEASFQCMERLAKITDAMTRYGLAFQLDRHSILIDSLVVLTKEGSF